VSEYESRRLAQYQRAAEESLRARGAAAFAADKARAEDAAARGAWDEALVVYQLLQRARPEEPQWAKRIEEARAAIRGQAARDLEREGARRTAETLVRATRDALARGDRAKLPAQFTCRTHCSRAIIRLLLIQISCEMALLTFTTSTRF
jgi:hypothetical protein